MSAMLARLRAEAIAAESALTKARAKALDCPDVTAAASAHHFAAAQLRAAVAEEAKRFEAHLPFAQAEGCETTLVTTVKDGELRGRTVKGHPTPQVAAEHARRINEALAWTWKEGAR